MNKYCVPFALGFVTGKTPDEVAAVIQGERAASDGDDAWRKRPVRVVYTFEYGAIMRALGVKVLAEVRKPSMTLRTWAANRVRWGDTAPWLVRISGHMVVYKDGKVYDNGCHGGATLDTFSWRNSRIKCAWQVTVT